LQELQIARGYEAIKLQMAGGENLLTIATQAGKQGNRAVIQAIRVYSAPLLVSMDADASMADAVERALELAESPYLSATQATCRDLAHELEVGASNLGGCAAHARSVASGAHSMSYLPTWQQGGSLPIAEAIPGAPSSPASRGGYQPIFPERGR
jgi:hypothetical protein